MCKKKNKKKSKKTNAKTEFNSDEDLMIISADDSCVLSEEELYLIRKSNYLEKTTGDLKKIRNILEGKIYRYEVNSTHSNNMYAFLAILTAIFTIIFSIFNDENDKILGILLIILAIFASGCLWVFYKENKNAELYQNMKENCIMKIGIINDILEEREKENALQSDAIKPKE